METRKALDAQAMGLMLLLCTVWGLQQVVLKIASIDMPAELKNGLALS